MTKVNIYQDSVLRTTIQNENRSDAENSAFSYLLRNQGQSTNWALKYGGWQVEVIENDNAPEFWQPYDKRQ